VTFGEREGGREGGREREREKEREGGREKGKEKGRGRGGEKGHTKSIQSIHTKRRTGSCGGKSQGVRVEWCRASLRVRRCDMLASLSSITILPT
jgi:hypothetical protein